MGGRIVFGNASAQYSAFLQYLADPTAPIIGAQASFTAKDTGGYDNASTLMWDITTHYTDSDSSMFQRMLTSGPEEILRFWSSVMFTDVQQDISNATTTKPPWIGNPLVTLRDEVAIPTEVQPGATGIVSAAQSTGTAPPLFGRAADPDAHHRSKRKLAWLPWAFVITVVVLFCCLAVGWRFLCEYLYNRKLARTDSNNRPLLSNDSSSTIDSIIFRNIFRMNGSACGGPPDARKVSGRQVVDPADTSNVRNRVASGGSFKTIDLHDDDINVSNGMPPGVGQAKE